MDDQARARLDQIDLGTTRGAVGGPERSVDRGDQMPRASRGRPKPAIPGDGTVEAVVPTIRIKHPLVGMLHPAAEPPTLADQDEASDENHEHCWRCDAAPATHEVGLCEACHRALTAG